MPTSWSAMYGMVARMPVIAIARDNSLRTIAAAHEIRGGDVAVAVADRPQARHVDEDDRVEDDRVGNRKETADRPGREHRGGHRHERVGRVEVAAEQKPRDPRAERAPAEPPFVQARQVFRAAPVRRPETHDRDQQEQTDQHRQRGVVDAGIHRLVSRCRRGRGRRGRARHGAAARAGSAQEDPQKLVPDEEREARHDRLDSRVAAHPQEADDGNRQQHRREGHQRLVGRGTRVSITLRTIHLHLRRRSVSARRDYVKPACRADTNHKGLCRPSTPTVSAPEPSVTGLPPHERRCAARGRASRCRAAPASPAARRRSSCTSARKTRTPWP